MPKPMIGVLPLYDKEKDSYWMLPGYMKGIEEAGGIPVILPLTSDSQVIRSLAETYDGFLFTGGQDVHPERYGEKKQSYCGETCRERDEMEFALFERILELDKPALGICRGLQLFNAVLGGTLYQDIAAQLSIRSTIIHKQEKPYHKPVHPVSLVENTPLYGIWKQDRLHVNSLHHQGIKQLSKHLRVAATAADGLVEAVYMEKKQFVLAVQWHPEFTFRNESHSFLLFSELVKASDKVISQ